MNVITILKLATVNQKGYAETLSSSAKRIPSIVARDKCLPYGALWFYHSHDEVCSLMLIKETRYFLKQTIIFINIAKTQKM